MSMVVEQNRAENPSKLGIRSDSKLNQKHVKKLKQIKLKTWRVRGPRTERRILRRKLGIGSDSKLQRHLTAHPAALPRVGKILFTKIHTITYTDFALTFFVTNTKHKYMITHKYTTPPELGSGNLTSEIAPSGGGWDVRVFPCLGAQLDITFLLKGKKIPKTPNTTTTT